MYEYLIIYSYWKNNRRVTEKDTFYAGNDQEAVDHCRAFNEELFAVNFGRIESVCRDESKTWDIRVNWE